MKSLNEKASLYYYYWVYPVYYADKDRVVQEVDFLINTPTRLPITDSVKRLGKKKKKRVLTQSNMISAL